MRMVSFTEDGFTYPGILEENRVRRIDACSLSDYIALEPEERALRHTEDVLPIERVQLTAPIVPPRNVFCVGRNYLEHVREEERASGVQVGFPDTPAFFTKAPATIAAPEQDLHFEAAVSTSYDYEAELAVVIGAQCKNVSEAEWARVVFGYTCLNDVTARDLQHSTSQWFRGKSLDESCPIGPTIVTCDEISDPHALAIILRVNGVEKQRDHTSHMIFESPASSRI